MKFLLDDDWSKRTSSIVNWALWIITCSIKVYAKKHEKLHWNRGLIHVVLFRIIIPYFDLEKRRENPDVIGTIVFLFQNNF